MLGPLFGGFPAGRVIATAIPNVFFTEILPEVDSLAELKLTLHVLWRISLKKNAQRYVTVGDLMADPVLLRSLGPDSAHARQALDGGLNAAVARRTLLRASVKTAKGSVEVVVANSETGRASLAQFERDGATVEEAVLSSSETVRRPNIFEMY
ncbi:MAG TPA: hypothetical protein VMP10_00490, partial [Chloroflexota bacterium]|nr:hypothetical protein [Chloroflexota bacterium]